MFASDAATFLADFGDQVSWTPSAGGLTVNGPMLFDQPDEGEDSGKVISREYLATYETAAWAGLKRGEQLMVTVRDTGASAVYRLRTDPGLQDDGVFSNVKLTKV